ncbi:MAG: TonB-dependent receptor [Lautropia sp.]|nr:TonB-dependent receptor [Lautropia sp.]
MAAFDIGKRNVLTRDPNNPDYNVAAGKACSRGLEADMAGQSNRYWRLTVSVAWLDTKVTCNNDATLLGKRLMNIPRISGSLFAMYEDSLPDGSRYGVGGGVVYVGERTANATDTWRPPGCTTVRLHGYWQLDLRIRLTMEVHNLFDRGHYLASWNRAAVIPGMGRQLVVGVQWRL